MQPQATSATPYWSSALERTIDRTVLVGPILMVVAALMITADVRRLPGDLNWASEPEGFLGVLAAVFFVPAWIAVGRRVASAAARTGVAITLLGVVGAIGWVYPFALRLLSADLVNAGFEPGALSEVYETGGTVFSALVLLLMVWGVVVPAIAGIAILRTHVAPRWAGAALVAFPPVFVAAQGAYLAIEVTYLVACVLLLVGVAGATRGQGSPAAAGGSGR